MWSVSPSKHDRGAGIPKEYPGGIAPTYVYPQGYTYKCAYGVFKNTVEVLNQIRQSDVQMIFVIAKIIFLKTRLPRIKRNQILFMLV